MGKIEENMIMIAKNCCQNLETTAVKTGLLDTGMVEDKLHIGRTQASKLLNRLVEENSLFKINTRPVLFGHKEEFEKQFSIHLPKELDSVVQLEEMIAKVPAEAVFEQMIGYDKSLQEPIEQLKTSVFYPGDGLPVMIIGDTGVGKSYFVQVMYEYITRAQILPKAAPFKILNCAQYFNNPELLSGLLFGYAKGAFTGAYDDRAGLLEDADGGLLFLDEVHRLNAEGQEKLFTFMDKGTFSRIGETKTRKAKVRLAFATTEKMNTFLQTFLRRIPIHIYIPNINERSIGEKKEIIERLFKVESKKLNRKIIVSARVMAIFLNFDYAGNIGEIENAIKYVCGSAIAHTQSNYEVQVMLRDLPAKMYQGQNSRSLEISGEDLVFQWNEQQELNPATEELQQFIERLNKLLSAINEGGQDLGEIKKIISQKAESFMDKLIFMDDGSPVALENFVHETMQDLFREIEYQTRFKYDGNFVLFVSHYIYRYMLRPNSMPAEKKLLLADFIEKNYRNEVQALHKLLPEIERRLDIKFHEIDLKLFVIFFSTLRTTKRANELDALIIAHGFATASSIANVCNRVLGNALYTGIDMPIEATIRDISKKVDEFVFSNEIKGGLVILIDMGSLNLIYDQLKKTVEVPILFMDQLGTLMALEIGNLIMQGESLESIAEKMEETIEPNIQLFQPVQEKRKAIITTCFTGLGTAVQIQRLLKDCLEGIYELDIFPIEFADLKTSGIPQSIRQQYQLLGIVGTDNPEVTECNFISLETIISSDNEKQMDLLFKNLLSPDQIRLVNNRMVKNFSLIRVIESLTILDSKKIIELVEELIQNLEAKLDLRLSNARKIGLYVHISCMIERLIRHSEIVDFPDLDEFAYHHQREIRVIQDAVSVLESVYSVQVPLTEVGYIHNILFVD